MSLVRPWEIEGNRKGKNRTQYSQTVSKQGAGTKWKERDIPLEDRNWLSRKKRTDWRHLNE